MTTAQTIIQAAYRENNIIPAGSDPTTAELTEALERLNRYIMGVYGHELGEPMMDWPVPAPQRTAATSANYPQLPYPLDAQGGLTTAPFQADPSLLIYTFPPKNSRLIFGSVSHTAWFPEAPDDGSRMMVVQGSGAGDGGVPLSVLTLDGNGRTIEGSNTKTLTQPIATRQWLYRAELGDWVVIQDLALSDNLPFPTDFDDLWICALAIRISPRYGKVLNVATADTFKSMLTKLKARYRQAGVTVYNSGDIPRSLQTFISGRYFY